MNFIQCDDVKSFVPDGANAQSLTHAEKVCMKLP